MTKDPLDKWLDALHFENYRLQFKPNQTHAAILKAQIRELESQPVADIAGNDLVATLHHLKQLKKDLASVQQLIDLAKQLRKLREQMREKGFLLYSQSDADEVLNGFHAWFEKTKIEQRERQWRNLASLRQFWPEADGPRRRRMVELFATYSRRRLMWGTLNLKIGAPLRIGRWLWKLITRPEHPITRILERLYPKPQDVSKDLISFAERTYPVFMHHHLALVLVLLFWPVLHALNADALAIPPPGSIITVFNRTEALSTPKLSVSGSLLNGSLAPSQNFISYRIPHSPVTLLFHSFGPTIPVNELLSAVAFAVGIAFTHISHGQGRTPIAHGFFMFTHEFLNHDEIGLTVGDFREIGRSMTYDILCDVLRGIGEFTLLQGQKTREVEFEVEIEDVGYVGTGHVDFKPVATPTSSVA
ncbi:MAG: hypothetical protein ASARMPREDX12_004923 [Alectoria sarmentosa]|nr:MAG: hypothetical protein ASARMPREDX12_004923 [Alectoria sarmentosa]